MSTYTKGESFELTKVEIVSPIMNFSEALHFIKAGRRLTRTAWFNVYYVYIDNKFPNTFQFILNRPFFNDEDLLATDWKIWIDPYATTNKISEVTNNA